MFEFLRNMWIMQRVTEAKLQSCVASGRITPEQYREITGEDYSAA